MAGSSDSGRVQGGVATLSCVRGTNVELLMMREPRRVVVRPNDSKMSAHNSTDPTSCFYYFSYRVLAAIIL